MTCEKCGKDVDDGQNFCPGCGSQMAKPQNGSVFNKDLTAGFRQKTWYKVVKAVGYVVAAAVIIFCFYMKQEKGNLNETAKSIIESGLPEHLANNDLGDTICVDTVKDVSLVKKSGNEYTGLAYVKLRAKKKPNMTETIQYELSGTYDGDTLMLEYKPSENGLSKFIAFAMKVNGESSDE